jgi:Ca-activated chloride channel family protein
MYHPNFLRLSVFFVVVFNLLFFITSCNQANHSNEVVAEASEYSATTLSAPLVPVEIEPVNTESYVKAEENPFKNVVSNPLSTFSIDVDRAAYANIRRMILEKTEVPKEAVRIEEMINYFDYKYPQPTENEPFAVCSEYAECPWNKDHKLLKLGLQGKTIENKNLPPMNLVLLLDVSGSMDEPNKLPLLKSSLELLVNQLTDRDKVSIVTYAGESGVALEPTSGKDKLKIKQAINELQPGGGTSGEEGLNLAYKMAKRGFIKNGNNRIVLATDGDFNLGLSSDEEMEKLIEEKRKSGIFLTCLGFGSGNFKDSKMEILANKGNGNYAYIDNISEANKFLGKEFGGTIFTIAKDVKIQIEFNPNQVAAYRLIGYENRMLNDEDFQDDKKDAGELGSGHQVTALYEIVPIGVNSPYFKPIEKLRYSENKDVKCAELAVVKLRYKKPNEDKSIEMKKAVSSECKKIEATTSDFKFASAVAMFGLKLSETKYAEPIKNKHILNLVNAPEIIRDEYRKEFVELVGMAN